MGSEAPSYGGGESGNCQLIIYFIFQFLTLSPFSNIFPFPQISNISHPKFYTLKTFEKSSKNSQIIIELKTVT